MPHSSGGGSHSSGSHSSGGGSSHSLGGGGGHSYVRTQSSYFAGSHRYVRYHDGRADYIYSSSSDLNKVPVLGTLLISLIYIPFIIAGIFITSQAVHMPKRLNTNYSEKAIIDDVTDRFTDDEEKQLKQVLTEFKEQTGIPVEIKTVENQYWEYYTDLSSYAYDEYINTFSDEDHWLIIYSDDLSDRQDQNNFNNWYFEGMQGDNTDKILTEIKTSEFNDDLTRQLMTRKNTTGEAFIVAFKNFNNGIMKTNIEWGTLGFAAFWNLFTIIHACIMLHGNLGNSRKYKDYIQCPDDNEVNTTKNEIRCDYCGGIYYRGTVLNCPHCGATLNINI